MFYFNPLLNPDFIRAYNYLNVAADADAKAIWQAAQQMTLYMGSYCAENNLPPDALAAFFGVRQSCKNHQTVAFLAAGNLVRAYQEALGGGDSWEQ